MEKRIVGLEISAGPVTADASCKSGMTVDERIKAFELFGADPSLAKLCYSYEYPVPVRPGGIEIPYWIYSGKLRCEYHWKR